MQPHHDLVWPLLRNTMKGGTANSGLRANDYLVLRRAVHERDMRAIRARAGLYGDHFCNGLSDGRTQPADHEGLAQALRDAGITVSTVGLTPVAIVAPPTDQS